MPQQVIEEVGVDNGYDTNFFGSIERASQRFDDLDEESKVFLNSIRGNGCDDDGDHRDIDIVEDDHDDIKSPEGRASGISCGLDGLRGGAEVAAWS